MQKSWLSVTAGLAITAFSTALGQWPELGFAVEHRNRLGNTTPGVFPMLHVTPGARVLTVPQYRGAISAHDPGGNDAGWSLAVGRTSEVESVARVGTFSGDSVWMADARHSLVLIVDERGRIARGMDRPSWVRPAWRDRHRFPLFAEMSWEAVYPEGDMLVRPARPRALFDTPGFDRSAINLMRVDRDGRILKLVATINGEDVRITLRSGSESRRQQVAYFARTFWQTSPDGRRVVVVSPAGLADSGAFVVTAINDQGDTLFRRRFVAPTQRISPAHVEASLARIRPLGALSAEQIRDTVRKHIPAFVHPVTGVSAGVDHSVWVWVAAPGATSREVTALVLDSTGSAVGLARIPRMTGAPVVSRDRIWMLERDGSQLSLVRLRAGGTRAAPPVRSAPVRAPSRRATPPG